MYTINANTFNLFFNFCIEEPLEPTYKKIFEFNVEEFSFHVYYLIN